MSSSYKVKIKTPHRMTDMTFMADTYAMAKIKALDFAGSFTVLEFYLVDRYDNILFSWTSKEFAPLHLAMNSDVYARPGREWGRPALLGFSLAVVLLALALLVLALFIFLVA